MKEVKFIIKCDPSEKETVISEWEAKGYTLRGEYIHTDGFSLGFGPPDDYRLGGEPKPDNTWSFDKEKWLNRIDEEKNRFLSESDYKMLYDIVEEMTPEDYQKWKKYRQDLRGIMETTEVKDAVKPIKVSWPTKPTISPIGP